MDRRRAAGALLALAACIASSAAAPTAGNHSALDLYDGAVVEGCYYNFQHYSEGDRIMTNEPCLNCTCHNRMLMCYLRVCPFTKPIGQNCTVEKRADQCCPIVTCPDVPVDLLTSTSTSSPAEYGATGLGKHDKYGCSIDGKYLPEGAKVPPTPNKPCEHCYCIRNMTTCVMQECTLHVDGCTPIYHKDVCCPVRYSCDHPEDEIPLLDDMTTTVRPTPGFILTTTTMSPVTQITQDCVHDDQVFADGALIKTEKACEHCYCMKGDIVCVVQECGTPMENEGKNCTSLPPREGQCCPDTYICEGDEPITEYANEFTTSLVDELTTLAPPKEAEVEGSGHRNEPDEIPPTDSVPIIPEVEGSGDEKVTVAPQITVETPIPSTQSSLDMVTEQKIVTTESDKIYAEDKKDATEKPQEEREQADITDFDKSTTVPITEKTEYISPDTIVPFIEEKVTYSTEPTLVEKDTEDIATESYKQPLLTVSEVSASEIPEQTTTIPDTKEKEDLPTTSSAISDGGEKVSEENIIESSTSDDKIGLDFETTPATSHTLTLEEVEKEESELDKHKIETETSTEEFITESNEFVSSSESSIAQQEEEPNKTAEGGLDKEITETHEFIPVTTGLPVLDVATTIDDEDIITEKEPDDEKYETTQRITSVPNVDEVLTQNKDKIAGEKYTESEILPSTISFSSKETETSTLNLNDFTDKATESPEYVTSKEHTSLVSSTDTEKSISPNIEQLTTITPKPYIEKEPTLEEKEKIPTAEMDNKLITTTLHSETGNYVDDVTTTATAIDLGLKTTSAVFDKDITVEDSKYITSSEISVPESESYYTTTEPDRSLNTIPAESIDKDNIPSVPHVSESEFSFTKDDGTSVTTESGSNDLENNKQDRTSTELYNEMELVTSSHELQFETNKSSEEKDIKNITPVLDESEQLGTERTTQMKDGDSTTIVAQTEFDKGVTTETAIDKTNIPDIVNQGENEIHEDTFIPSRIPGEGDCLQSGITYKNQSNVPSTNNCHTGCKCISSIIKCDPIICSPPPDYMDNCQPTYDPPDACCPTYECTHSSKETIPPQSQNQMSGTEAPVQRPSIECHGDQCEINEDKIEPTISHETCIGDKCKVDLDKKVEPSECGPQGCDKKDEEISVPQVSEHPDENCVNGKCHATKIELAQPCEGNKCIDSTDIPSLSCEGEKCTDQTKPTLESQQGISCNQENGCLEGTEHGISECEGESCRNKESTIVEKKPSTLCNNGDSSCLENNDRVSEHETDITTSSPINDITKADEHITHKTGIDKEMQITLNPEDTVTTVPVDIEIPETQEIQTQKPETTGAELDITKQDSSTFKGETATDVAVTEKIEDILSVTQSAKEEEYTTEMKILVPDDAQNELETLEYEKESDKKENTQVSTAIDKETIVQPDIKPLHMDSDKTTSTSYDDSEPGRVTKHDEEGSGYMDTEPHDITTELSMIEERSTSSPDVHVTASSSAQQFTDEISYTTEKQQSIENATVPQYLPESHEPETTEILKPVTESELNIDLPLTTITSTLVEGVTQPEDEQTKTGDKDENLNEKTTQYETITSKKPTDTVISIATTPEYVQTVYEEATTKSEIDSTIADKIHYYDHGKEKIEPPTTSDIDTEEYITEKPEEGGIYGEKQTTLGDGLDSLSEVTERSEGVSEEQLQEQEPIAPEINTDVTDIEVVKESFTTESTKTPKSDEPTKETIHETDNVHQQHVSETPEHEYYDKTTTEASISPSIEKEHEPDQPAITAQEELSTEDSLVPVTDKIYINDNEKEIEKLGKPVGESTSTDEPLVFISTTDTIVEKVTHDIHVTSAETEGSEHMIPVTTDINLQSVTKGMELEENDEFTTIEDNKLYTKQDITTQPSKTEFVSHTDSPINEYTQTPADKSELITETPLTITSIIEGSESVTTSPQATVTEVPQKETILPGAESYATTELYSTKGTDTQTSLGLELESKPTTNTEDTDIQKITVIPVTSQYDTQPHHEEKETTESGQLESTVTEAKDDKIPSKSDTILQEHVTESSKVTEKVDEHKMETTSKIEEDISSISNELPATVEDEKISDLLESIRTEQPSVTIIDDSTTSDIIVPDSDNNKDKTTQSASIYDIGHKEAQTLSPTTAIVEIGTTPLEEEITEHKVISTESPEGIHDDKKETSPIYYTKQTTESNIKFSEDTSKISYDDTTPLQVLEYSSTPSYEHSENQPDLVELEEHTHKIPEEYSTTTLTISDKASSSTESTENHEDKMVTSLSPDKEKDISDNTVTEKIIEESGSMRPDSGEDKISDFETTEKIEPVQTIEPNLEKQTSQTEFTDTALDETRTTQLPSSKDQIIVATEKAPEETVTTHNPKEKISPTDLIDKTLEEALSTTTSSLERDTGITKVTENIPEKTTISPHLTSKDELIHPSSTVNILEALTTTEPTLQKETSTTSPTDNVLEEKLTTPLITSIEESSDSDDKDSIGHPKPEKDTGDAVISDKISVEIGTTSPPVFEEGAGEPEATDKDIKDSATTMQPSIEKETSNAGQIDEGAKESITTLLPSYQEEASKADSTDILLETTTRRFEKEPGHEISTNKVLEEFKTTLPPTSEEKITDSMATDDGLKDTITPYPSSFEKEISHSEESDTYKVTEETPTTYNIIPVEETSHTTTADKILEETGTTTLSSVQEINDIKNTENILEESSTTLRPVSEEVTIHDDTENNSETPVPSQQSDSDNVIISHTDIILEDNKTTHPSFEEITKDTKDTDKILEETMTTQGFSHEEDVSHSVTIDKIIEENLTTKHYIPEDTTAIASEVSATTARTSMEEKTTYAEITEKVMEDIATTPRIPSDDQKSQEESQKGEPVLESTSERVTDEKTVTETDKSTEIKEEGATPVKESTETYLPTTSSAPEITSQSILAQSSSLSVPQVTEVKHTTESQEKEITSVAPVSEKIPPSSIKPLEPEGEVVPTTTTTKATTVSIDEYVTTHAPASVDKYAKPEEHATETSQSPLAPELPKPSGIQPTDEVPTPEEESHFPPSGTSGYGGEPDYGDEDQAFGPGTCRYGGKVYVSAQQIPRDDPCDFCFCFRSDIICLQQSCPPPIHGCHEEPIQGFCCPRYECPVSMATTLNVTTTTTTTTTTLPPHFPTHSYKGAAQRRGCQIKGHTYKVGEVVRASSGPCLHCTCGGDGQMKCDPKACTPEPMLRQMIAAAVSAKRRR